MELEGSNHALAILLHCPCGGKSKVRADPELTRIAPSGWTVPWISMAGTGGRGVRQVGLL